jgi:hypothetical protein
MRTQVASMIRHVAIAALLLAALAAAACLSRTGEDTDGGPPGELLTGQLRLEEYPVETVGITGLGPLCRVVSSCGCPLLSPEDIEWCREDVRSYTEEFCQSVLENQVPECLEE